MSKSLMRMLLDATDLVAFAGLSIEQLVAITVDTAEVNIHLKPKEFFRVSRFLEIDRSSITFYESDVETIHLRFNSRDAWWVTCFAKDRLASFSAELRLEPSDRVEQSASVEEHFVTASAS